MKRCAKCGIAKPFSEFFKNKARRDGVTTYCKPCQYEYNRARPGAAEYAKAYAKSWNKANSDRKNELRRGKRQAEAIRARERRATDPSFVVREKEASKKWRLANRDKSQAKCTQYHTSKLQRAAVWEPELTEFVTVEAHNLAKLRKQSIGGTWHVDHIIPLRGTLVSGLHVWNNLQVLLGIANSRKGNRFTPG